MVAVRGAYDLDRTLDSVDSGENLRWGTGGVHESYLYQEAGLASVQKQCAVKIRSHFLGFPRVFGRNAEG